VAISPLRECARLSAARLGFSELTAPEKGWASIDAIYLALDERTARLLKSPDYTGVYAYEDGALASLRAARAMGKAAIYELPIAFGPYAKTILEEEAQRRPKWRFTLGGLSDSDKKMARKRAEIEAADLIITPSQFVLDSIPATVRSSRPCAMVPYGADPAIEDHEIHKARNSDTADHPLRLLFVGSFSQRKGLADILDACSRLSHKDIELHLLGSPMAPLAFYRRHYPNFIYHSPCARSTVIETMLGCDVLMLPSLVEGRALVQLEALSCGLPIIISPNTGGDDLLDEGKTGWKVDPSSPDQLADRIEWFVENRDRLPEMRSAALAMARSHSWEASRRELINAVRPFL
jgi:glycosyltransferase involved in cell wall biosynthesis